MTNHDEEIAFTVTRPFISVVTTLYHSAEYVPEFHRQMSASLASLTDRFEIIMVNDGSPDNALEVALEIQKADPHVILVDLSRNHGQHKAMMTGMRYTGGDYVFLIEVDLEEEPRWVIEFYQAMTAEPDVDVVFGVQERRKGGFVERLSGALFYKLFNLLSDVKMPENHVTTRLMRRAYVDGLLQYREQALFLGGVYQLVGFNQHPLIVSKKSHSETTYTLRKKMVLLVNAVTSFSTFPLTLVSWAGLLMTLFSLAFIVYIVGAWWLRDVTPGWTGIVASVWMVGGTMMMALGVIGVYLKRILDEVKDRPYALVKQIYKSEEDHV